MKIPKASPKLPKRLGRSICEKSEHTPKKSNSLNRDYEIDLDGWAHRKSTYVDADGWVHHKNTSGWVV